MGSSNRGSTNKASNLICLCEPCHREVESNREMALLEGYLVPQHGEPSAYSIKHGRLGFVHLSDLGEMETV